MTFFVLNIFKSVADFFIQILSVHAIQAANDILRVFGRNVTLRTFIHTSPHYLPGRHYTDMKQWMGEVGKYSLPETKSE